MEQKCISVDTKDTFKIRFRLLKVTLFSSLMPSLLIYSSWLANEMCSYNKDVAGEGNVYDLHPFLYIQYTMPER